MWTVIDDDHLLPHNAARHQFSSGYVGLPKADLVATFCDSILEGDGDAKSIVANVLSPGEREAEVHGSLQTADVIIDFSASVPVPPRIEIAANTWRLVVTEQLIQKMRALREAKLPNETGGVFIGHFDTAASAAYIVDTIPAPPDSKEYPVHYIRGSAGLRTLVKGIEDSTATMLHYVGEWHSHPNGYSCAPSSDDQKVFAWLTRWMQIDGYPGLMLIAGQQMEAWFIGRME